MQTNSHMHTQTNNQEMHSIADTCRPQANPIVFEEFPGSDEERQPPPAVGVRRGCHTQARPGFLQPGDAITMPSRPDITAMGEGEGKKPIRNGSATETSCDLLQF